MDFDEYWRANGASLATISESPEHLLVESILRASLPDLEPIKDVLDVGCGRGRIARILLDALPKAAYTGMDIGDAQISHTMTIRPDGEFYLSRLQDFSPLRDWDLVIASEVLMHIPPDDIWGVADKLKGLARKWIVLVEWTKPVPEPIAEWNWLYNYPAMFGEPVQAIPVYDQTIFLFRP